MSNSCQNGGTDATGQLMVCALKDFKVWRFCSYKMSVQGFEMELVCQRVVSQLRNTLPNGVSAAKWRIFKVWRFRSHFAAAKQVYGLTKWHSCAKGPLRSCENFRRGRLEAAKPFRSENRFSQRVTFGCEISQAVLFPCFLSSS